VSRAVRIGIYVHHHGGGHAARAGAIGAALEEAGAAVTYLSSLPAERFGTAPHVALPLDTDLGEERGETPAELHFAPLGSAGLAERMARIARWIANRGPDLLLVDVSVEVAMLARLCGVPFAYLRQTGERNDPPHRRAYQWAAGLLAPFPAWLEPPSTRDWIRHRTGYAGGITRFDGESRPTDGGRGRRAIVLGEGGEELGAEIAAAAPGWEILGPRHVDLDLLASCAVVVAPGGANSVAEAAFARCGLVCIPQPRPFREQVARGEDLEREGAAVVLWDRASSIEGTAGSMPGSDRGAVPPMYDGSAAQTPIGRHDWPTMLSDAYARRDALARWADGSGARRAADYLIALARESRGDSVPASSSQSISPVAESSSSQPLAGHSPQLSR
jgi:hypothetical protein